MAQKLSDFQPRATRYDRRGLKAQIRRAINNAQRSVHADSEDEVLSEHKQPGANKPEDIVETTGSIEDNIITAPSEIKSHLKDLRLDELNEEQLKIYGERCWLVALMSHDVLANEAIRRLNLSYTPHTARNIYRRFEKKGFEGLIDKRWLRQTKATVFTSEVKLITLFWYFSRPAAGYRAIWKKVCEDCRSRELKEPCETSVKDYLANLDEGLKLFRLGKVGIRKWEQTACPVIRYENTTYANELWQGDHGPLRIWVKVKVNGVWKPFRVYITVLIDAHTRAIMGHVVSTKYPDSWTIALAFWRAIMPKEGRGCKVCGLPKVFESDRGRDFISEAIAATLCSRLSRCLADPIRVRYP